jgi:hypothetical protein
VVDGYNTDNYYHLNFGWGGSYNGWYLLPQEIPYNLTVIEGVILDIMKSSSTNICSEDIEYNSTSMFPNPCRYSTTFSFYTPYHSEIEIKLYDVIGNEIKTSSYKTTKGNNTFNLSVEDCLPGVYLYTIRTGKTIESGKLVIIE